MQREPPIVIYLATYFKIELEFFLAKLNIDYQIWLLIKLAVILKLNDFNDCLNNFKI